MKRYISLSFLFLLSILIFSCSDDSSFENDDSGDQPTVIELRQSGNQSSITANEVVVESAGFDISWCIQKCNLARKECHDWATENRTYRLIDCEEIRIESFDLVDVYCTQTVIIAYDYIDIYSPENEYIRTDTIPIYGEEQYVCGQERTNIVLTENPVLLQQYDDCIQQAQDEFVDAIDDCDVKLIECEENCRKPKPKKNDE